MGKFKAKNHKKRFKKKVALLSIFIIVSLLVYNYLKQNKIINPKYLELATRDYLKMDFIKEEKEVKQNVKEVMMHEDKTPVIYIYNTHQEEKYKSLNNNPYNIDYNVMFASYLLKDYLEDEGYYSYVETSSVNDILKQNNWSYGYSYMASRKLLEQSIIKIPTLSFFIDIHRDSSSYENTTFENNNIKYAKILFVVGLENENYEENLKVATLLNDLLKKENENFSRGIMKKQGPGVNGIYNQDFNKNTILIELGGQYNEIEEVSNTLKVFAKVLSSYLREEI